MDIKFNKDNLNLLNLNNLNLSKSENLINEYFPEFNSIFLKKGGKIYIKKKNRGKFTASAKRAGRSVQEHAKAVLNDPNATPLQKKRANFARNAAKWNHKKKK